MKRNSMLVVALGVVLMAAVAVPCLAQSQIQVTAIKLNPSTFKIGNTVTIATDIKNAGAARTNAGTAYVDIFKSDSWLASERVFHAEQPVVAMAAGATRTVTFASRWRVADAGTGKFYVRVAVVDPPNEFGNPKSVVYIASCSYSRLPQLVVLPALSARELRPQ
jgi:hypothetical protein